MEERHNKVGLN